MLSGKAVVSVLAKKYGVTEETIRRDLEKLEDEGYAKKTYGGAVINDASAMDLPYVVRKQTNVGGKRYIAEIISKLINDGDRLLLDSSTTALFTVKSIADKENITLLTNSVEILHEAAQNKTWNVISTGGTYKSETDSLLGGNAKACISKYYADYAILSCKGIDIEKGITDTREEIADLKETFFKSAKNVILAVDHTKLDKISFVRFSELSNVDIIVTDLEPNDLWKKHLSELGIELLYK